MVRKARTHQHLEMRLYKGFRGFTTSKVSIRYLWRGKSIYEVSMGPPLILMRGERKRLSLIAVILLTHIKAGFEKKGLTAVVIVMVTAYIH